MNCHHAERLLWSYVENALSAAQREALAAHLQQCEWCQQRLQAVRLTHTALQSLPRYRAPERLVERVRAEIAAQPKSVARRTVRPALWRWTLAPALGLLVAALWWWSQTSSPAPITDSTRPDASGSLTQQAAQEYADTCIELHQQLEMADWAGTPTVSYLITTGYTR